MEATTADSEICVFMDHESQRAFCVLCRSWYLILCWIFKISQSCSLRKQTIPAPPHYSLDFKIGLSKVWSFLPGLECRTKLRHLMLKSQAKLSTNKIKLEPHCFIINGNTDPGHLNPPLIYISKELIKSPLMFILKCFPLRLALA